MQRGCCAGLFNRSSVFCFVKKLSKKTKPSALPLGFGAWLRLTAAFPGNGSVILSLKFIVVSLATLDLKMLGLGRGMLLKL